MLLMISKNCKNQLNGLNECDEDFSFSNRSVNSNIFQEQLKEEYFRFFLGRKILNNQIVLTQIFNSLLETLKALLIYKKRIEKLFYELSEYQAKILGFTVENSEWFELLPNFPKEKYDRLFEEFRDVIVSKLELLKELLDSISYLELQITEKIKNLSRLFLSQEELLKFFPKAILEALNQDSLESLLKTLEKILYPFNEVI